MNRIGPESALAQSLARVLAQKLMLKCLIRLMKAIEQQVAYGCHGVRGV